MFERDVKSTQKRSIKESLLLLLCAILAAAVAPFAYLRLRDEHLTMAYLDIAIVCVMLLLFVYVYVGRRVHSAGVIMALGFIAAALMTTLLMGVGLVYWAYPALTVAFFMLGTRQATVLSVGFICCFMAILWDEMPLVELATICLTLVIAVLLAYAFALTNQKQQARWRRMANIDPLTSAGNRRALNQKLDSVSAILRRNNAPGSLLILDVDHFKRINDAYGHITGDQILVDIAELVRSATRATESLYRYGGEEFVVVAELTGLEAATRLAENLREKIERRVLSAGIKLTVSIGVAELQRDENREAWLGRADAVLFKAKSHGRNRVAVSEAHETTVFPVGVPNVVRLSS